MAAKQFFSGLATFCASTLTNNQTSITGQSTATWSSTGDYIVQIQGFAPGTSTNIFENVLVTANNQGTGVLTVTRAQDGTNGQAFAAGATLTPVISNKMIADAFVRLDATNVGFLSFSPGSGYSAPATSAGSSPIKIDDILVGTDGRYPAATPQITFLNTSNSGTNLLPTGFRHLSIEWYARGDTAATSAGLYLRFNNISTNTYDQQYVIGSGATASAAESLTQTQLILGNFPAASATANYFGVGECKVRHYNGTVGNKIADSVFYFMSADTTGTAQNGRYGGKWRTTGTAVTRIDLLPTAGNFVNGSLFTLWGLP